MLEVLGPAICHHQHWVLEGTISIVVSVSVVSTESTLGLSYFSMTFASNLERVEMDKSDGQCPGHVPTCGHKST